MKILHSFMLKIKIIPQFGGGQVVLFNPLVHHIVSTPEYIAFTCHSNLFIWIAWTMSSSRRSALHDEESIYRIPPYYYIHVLDQNTNVTKVEVGPKTFIRQDNEKVMTSSNYWSWFTQQKIIKLNGNHPRRVIRKILIRKDAKLVVVYAK